MHDHASGCTGLGFQDTSWSLCDIYQRMQRYKQIITCGPCLNAGIIERHCPRTPCLTQDVLQVMLQKDLAKGSGRWQVDFKLKRSIPCNVKAMNFSNVNRNDFGEKRQHQKLNVGYEVDFVVLCIFAKRLICVIYIVFWQLFFLKSTDDYSVSSYRLSITPVVFTSVLPDPPTQHHTCPWKLSVLFSFWVRARTNTLTPTYAHTFLSSGFCHDGPCLWGSRVILEPLQGYYKLTVLSHPWLALWTPGTVASEVWAMTYCLFPVKPSTWVGWCLSFAGIITQSLRPDSAWGHWAEPCPWMGSLVCAGVQPCLSCLYISHVCLVLYP